MALKNTSKMIANNVDKASTLRFILGDQLNPLHSWFTAVDDNVIYVLMELRQETDYVLHHAQKIIAIFAGMRDFAAQLERRGIASTTSRLMMRRTCRPSLTTSAC